MIGRRLLVALALLPFAAADWAAATDLAGTLRSTGMEFCFGRVHDRMKRARQPLADIHVFKGFTMDPQSEDKPVSRESMVAADQAAPKVTIVRRTRDRKVDDIALPCDEEKPGAFVCMPESEELAALGFRLRASGDKLFATSGLNEKDAYRLAPRPIAECLGARDQARPAWVGQGEPIRVRFAARAPVCHAGTTKGQSLTFRVNRPVELDPSDKVPHSMLRATVTIRLRDGATRTRHVRCDSAGYDFWCQSGHGVIHLARAGDRRLTVFEGRFEKRAGERSPMEIFFDAALKPDERRFVVEERDMGECPE